MLNLRSHIESGWNKFFKDVEWISLESAFFALFSGMTFGLLIISTDYAVLLKLIMLVLFPLGILISASDMRDPGVKRSFVRRSMVAMLFAMLICEINLFHRSSYEEIRHITVITNETVERTNVGTMKDPTYEDIQYVVIEFYSGINNERIFNHHISKSNYSMINFYKSVTGIRTYIEYAPFMTYREKVEYIRKPE